MKCVLGFACGFFYTACAVAFLAGIGDDVPGQEPLPVWWTPLCVFAAVILGGLGRLCSWFAGRIEEKRGVDLKYLKQL